MEVVVMPQLSGAPSGGTPSILRYKIAEKTVVDGTVQLADRTINVVKLASSDAVRVIFPSKSEGCARDFILRLEVSVSTVPEITFVGAEGESVKVEDDGLSDLGAKYGANIYSVTETAPSRLFVIRKSAYLVGEAS